MRTERERGTTLHVGIVHGVAGIHYVAAADTTAALMKEIAIHVRRQSTLQLYPHDAGEVDRLLARGEDEDAVRYYFERVGARWDREWLTQDVVQVARGRAGTGDVIPLFDREPSDHERLHAASETMRG